MVVTGASGFIGSHVAKSTIAAGFKVFGTTRSDRHNEELLAAVPGLQLLTLDLLTSTEDDITALLEGCSCRYLMHVASPFPGSSVTDEEMKTAVAGTEKMVRAAKRAGVARLIVTSSVAAISANWPKKGSQRKGTAENPFTGEDWSVLEGLTSSYSRSKTVAEQTARSLCEELDLEIATIHPSFVQGPLLLPRQPTSTALCKRMLEGAMPAVPAVGMNVVSVLDVADAHVQAITAPPARYIVAAGNILYTDLARRLAAKYAADGWRIKTRSIPWFVFYCYTFLDAQAAAVLPMWKDETYYDCSNTEAMLGRPLQDAYASCDAMAQSLIRLGVVQK